MGRDENNDETKVMALVVLKAINKSAKYSLQINDVPRELCKGVSINLSKWTMIVTDNTLKMISEQSQVKDFYAIDCSHHDIPSMFKNFLKVVRCDDGLKDLNISGAKDVTEFGLSLVARKNSNLKALDISGCVNIGDAGLREIGMNCKSLATLTMSGCHAIEGSGLISISDYCKFLLKIDISKCRGLQAWSVKKIFYGCHRLEEVNVSNMNIITDEEIRVLAQNCPNLLILNAEECPYLSDQSLLVLSQHCADIDLIDISRTQMAFRISDVSLLALGQRSASLRVLRLHGCDQISDVGLTWLAEGCKALEELDIGGCPKVSDAGLRSIGNGCHALKSIDISQNKLISDIGVTSISSGCPHLRKLICTGLYLLADPRLSAPRKGETAEPWQAVVGIAAVAKYCPHLEYLNVSGCFRLNTTFQKHVLLLINLKVLTLVGCNQTTSEGLEAVALQCCKLEELNLSECGKSVNNKSVTAFATHAIHLKVLVLCRCENVRAGAMRAIAGCSSLEKLDLSGCRSLTDMMILPITEVGSLPKLRFLSLTHNQYITDSAVAWIASKDHSILLLAIKGTSISKHGVKAVRDYFPYSDMVDNENFFGFWPKSRVGDRKTINHYAILQNGITKIQARLRQWQSKKVVSSILLNIRRDKAVVAFQRLWRRHVAMKEVNRIRRENERLNVAAILITSFFYIPQAKKRLKRQLTEKIYRENVRQAIKIQVFWRIVMDKNKLYLLQLARTGLIERRRKGAVAMQSIGRMYLAKLCVDRMKRMKQARFALINRKGLLIQRCYRGYLGKKIAKIARHALFVKTVLHQSAVNKIQKCRKAYNFRLSMTKRIQVSKRRHDCATKISATIRGALARIYVAEIVVERDERRRQIAATRIQSRWRTKQAYLLLRRMAWERAEQQRKQNAGAVVLQTEYRRRLARLEFARRKDERRRMLKRQIQLKLDSATKIQALFRGNNGRVRFNQVLRERKGKWKELFDDAKQRRFFYNKLTGEIRWRMPQDLLDLIPIPKCDNCIFYDGTIECAVCNEVFCHQCFEHVHYGGRRKDHDFRSLFDYYGKRIDYGDGVFPCKWPSEVIQDEVQGWMLRVAPIRDPVALHRLGWEEYKELDKNGGPSKVFYFNRSTFEATYDIPPDIAALSQMDSNVGQLVSPVGFGECGDFVGQNSNGWGTQRSDASIESRESMHLKDPLPANNHQESIEKYMQTINAENSPAGSSTRKLSTKKVDAHTQEEEYKAYASMQTRSMSPADLAYEIGMQSSRRPSVWSKGSTDGTAHKIQKKKPKLTGRLFHKTTTD